MVNVLKEWIKYNVLSFFLCFVQICIITGRYCEKDKNYM